MRSLEDLAQVLRDLRRRHGRQRGVAALTYRELAAETGWSHGSIGEYLSGRVLPPTDRLDVLVRLLGATPAEQGALATARDRVEEGRRRVLPGGVALADVPVPRQLPVDVSGFTGRATELSILDGLTERALTVVTGTAGVGKTALVVHWAHRVTGRFPDGQLYVDLRGYDPAQPLDPADALAGFLRALGVRGADIPGETGERAACFRTVLAGRRVLLLLDNAASEDQVRPLLPGTASCVAVATSRDTLTGLVIREGAGRLELAALRPDEAVALLRTLVGPGLGDAGALAERCARLPLALRIVAEYAAAHPGTASADLLAELDDEQYRLEVLDRPGDPRTAVRSVFSWSYQHLSRPAAAAFGLIGVHPGPDIEGYALAALADTSTARARGLLDELARAHLIEAAGHGRATIHDLLRAYAAERAGLDLGATAVRVALTRLFDHYVHAAAAAAETLFPHDRDAGPPRPPARTPAPRVDTAPRATRWLDQQLPVLVGATRYAAGQGWPGHAAALSRALWRYLEVGGHYQEALAIHSAAAAAPGGHDRAAVVANLGGIHWWLGDHQLARTYFEQALAGYQGRADPQGEARALSRLGLVHERLGDYRQAAARLGEALVLHRRRGNRHGEAAQLLNLGTLRRRHGSYAEAVDQHRRAAAIFAELGDRRLEGYALGNLGADLIRTGECREALEHLARALAYCRAAGDPGGEGSALATIGAAYHRMGRHPEALDHATRALAISRATGDRGLEVETLNALGEILAALGRPDAALEQFQAGLALAAATGDRYEQARALDGAAGVLDDLARPAEAAEHRCRALPIYQALGVPAAERPTPS